MLGLLEGIAQSTNESHPYLGGAQLVGLRKELALMGEHRPVRERWKLHFIVGQQELRLGNEQAAIKSLSRAYELLGEAQPGARWAHETTFHLGVAYMRLGETQNCCQRPSPDNCILPLRGDAVHTRREGSSQAIRYFLEVLDRKPGNLKLRGRAQWLLNIAHMTLGSYPAGVPPHYVIPDLIPSRAPDPAKNKSDQNEPEKKFPRFRNRSAELGVDTFSLSGGVIVDDFDGDDYLDVVTSSWNTTGQLRFFRNNADGTFSDRTELAGLTGLYGGLNLKQTDYDNDGHLDILVLRGAWLKSSGQHPNSLLRNHGDGTFTDVTFDAGLGKVHYPTQTAAWADYDNDGDLDVYIGNEQDKTPVPCQLFRNNGDGTFTDVATRAGVENHGYTKGVAWGDFDGDRDPDLYVSNYSGPNRLYVNHGDGTFTDSAPDLGVTRPRRSFPVWFWDFDNDGVLDLFAASYTGTVDQLTRYSLGEPVTVETGCLYRGNGQGGFREVSAEQGLDAPILPMGSNFGDLDGDGDLDFYLGTGDPQYWSLMPNLMFLNRGGAGFSNITMAGGFGHLQKGHGVAFADLDNDGDLDVFEQMGGAFPGDKYRDALYENPGFGNGWITVELVGRRSNRAAIGARLRVEIVEESKRRSIYRHVSSGGSFGANPLRQTIGIGKSRIVTLEVFWPTTNLTEAFDGIAVNQAIRIVEGESQWTPLKLNRLRLGG